jgi:MFS family permease
MDSLVRKSRRSSAIRFNLNHQGLQDIRLDDSAGDLSPTMEPRPARFRNVIHEMLFVVVCSFAGATFMFLQRSLVVILDPLQMSLSMVPSELSWTVAGPGLSAGALLLPMVFLMETAWPVSRRYTLVCSLLLYSLFVGICAASMHGVFLDVMVSLAGVTSAIHLATALSILDSAYPFPSTRKTVTTTFFLASGDPAAIIVGSMLSGLVASHFGWRGPFVFLSILSALGAVLAMLAVPDFDRQPNSKLDGKDVSEEEEASRELSVKGTSKVRDFDWRGTLLLILSVGLSTVALTSAPEAVNGWSTPYVWLLLVISLVCVGMFVFWEKVAEQPVIPRPIWDKPGLLAMLLFVFLISMAGCALLFWVPLFMEQVQMQTALQTAVRLLPFAVAGVCSSPLGTLVMYRVNHSLVAAASAFCMIASNITLMYLRSDSGYWTTTFPAMILSTVAMDWSLGVATVALASSLPRHYQTTGLGMVVTVARQAVPAGLAVTTAIHTSFAGRSNVTYPEVPYTNVFYTTLSLAVLALTLVPFLHFDKPTLREGKMHLSMMVNVDPSEELSYRDFIDNLPSFPIQPRKSSLYANQPLGPSTNRKPQNKADVETGPSDIVAAGASQRSSATADRVIWLVCEDCGASKRIVEQVGDPARYFYDNSGGHKRGPRTTSGDMSSAEASVTSTVRRMPLCKDVNSLRG